MLLRRKNRREHVVGAERLVSSHIQEQTLITLAELNDQGLGLMAEQSLLGCSEVHGLHQVGELCRTLGTEARARAAACPFLLLDAGFSDPKRWRGVNRDPWPRDIAPFFSVRRSPAVAWQVVFFAWHLAQSKGFDAQLLLGMPVQCSNAISSCTLQQIHEIAEESSSWLCLRWPHKMRFWRRLLIAAASGDHRALEAARLQGLQLIAADVLRGSCIAV